MVEQGWHDQEQVGYGLTMMVEEIVTNELLGYTIIPLLEMRYLPTDLSMKNWTKAVGKNFINGITT